MLLFFRPSNKLICSHIHDLIFTCLFLLGCEQVLTVANGSISSPAFGLAPYPSNQECTYLVKRPKGGPLSLRFTHFDLDDGDFVQVSFLHLHRFQDKSEINNKMYFHVSYYIWLLIQHTLYLKSLIYTKVLELSPFNCFCFLLHDVIYVCVV